MNKGKLQSRKKAVIALTFATIMIFSGVGIMGFEVLSQWNPHGIGTTPDSTTITGGTSDVYYGISVTFTTGSASSGSNTNTASAEDTTYSYTSYPAPSYPAYPGYPGAPAGDSYSLDIGSTEVTSGSVGSVSYSHSQSYDHTTADIDGRTVYYTHAYSYSHTTKSWSGTYNIGYTFSAYGSSGGTDNSWTLNLGGSTATTGTVDVFSGTPTATVSAGQSGYDEGQSATLSVSVANSNGGDTYQWYVNGAAVSGATGTTYTTSTFTSTSSSSYYVQVSGNNYVVNSNTYTITPDTSVSASISSNLNPSDVGQSVVFTASGSGGSGSYSNYNFYLNGNSVQSGSSNQWTEDFTSGGSNSVYVVVTDTNGGTGQSSTISQIVYPDPQAYLLNDMTPGVFYVYSYTSGPTEGAVPYSDISSYPLSMPASFPNSVSAWTGTFNDGGFGYDYGNPGYSGGTYLGRPVQAYPSSLGVLNTEPGGGAYDEGYMAVTVLYFAAGTYTFNGEYDDNGAMFISNNGVDWTSIIGSSAWHSEGATAYSGTETLSAGWYFFVVDNGNMGGGPSMSALNITGGSISTSGTPPITNPTDAGNTQFFLTAVMGGSGTGYTYSLTGTGATYTTPAFNTTLSSGSYTVSMTATDANGITATASASQVINSDPTVSASSNVSSADVNYPIEFSSSPSGGTSPYTYSWTIGGTQVSTSQDFSQSFSTAGTYTVEVTVTDSIGETYSASVTVTINNNPSVSVSSSQNPTDVGNSVTFTASESGGTGTISYAWTINGASEGSGSTLDYSFSSSGTYTVEVTVTDSDGHVASASITETVYSDPSVSVSSSQNPTDVGNSVTFAASPSGGSGSYTYQWYENSAAISGATSSTYTTSFSSSGTYDFYVIIHDSVGNSAQSSTLDETVNSDPSVSISSSQNPTDIGNSVTFTATGSGGTGSYTYQWYLNGTAVSGSTDSTFTTTFSYSGSPTIYVVLSDSLGDSSTSSTITEKVNPDPEVSVSSSQNPTDVGNSVTFTASASKGTGSFSYVWYLNGATQSSTSSTFSTSFSSAGTYYINVTVKDSVGNTASYSLIETVNVDPTVSVKSSQNPTDIGNSVTFTASPSGGTGSYTYQWYVNDAAVSGATSQSYTTSFSSAGTDSVYMVIKDSIGNSATSSTITETVNPDPSVSISSSQNPTDVGNSVTFTASPSGGSTPYSYAWYNDGTLESSTTSTYTTSFSSAGTYTIEAIITDINGNKAYANYSEMVNVDPTVSVKSSQNPTDIGNSVTFTATPSGGTSPYTYQWYYGSNSTAISGATQYEYTRSFSATGTYEYYVIITDANGNTARAYFNETVNSDPSVTVSESPSPTDVNVSVTFMSSPYGGTLNSGYYNFTWDINGIDYYTQNVSVIFKTAGTYSAQVTIRDSNGNTATATESIVVNPDPTVSISTEYNPVYSDTNDTLYATGNYGTGSYNLTWENVTDSTSPTVIGYGPNILYEWGSAGTYTLDVTIRDSLGETSTAFVTITVNIHPSVYISGPVNVTVGKSNTWSLVADNITTNGKVQWFNAGTSTNDTSPFFTYAYPISNTSEFLEVSYYVQGQYYNYTLHFRVNPLPTVGIDVKYSTVDAGVTDQLSAVTSGGSPGFSYSWNINGAAFSSKDISYAFPNAGTYTVKLAATDGDGVSVSTETNVTVLSDPSVSITTSSSQYDVGYSATFSATATGGNGSFTYKWYIGGVAVSSATSSNFAHSFNSAGSYTIYVVVQDSFGVQATSNQITVDIVNQPFVEVSASRTTADVGEPITFSSAVFNGTAPYTYEWLIGTGDVSNKSSFTYIFSLPGTYTVEVSIEDSDGYSAVAMLNVTIQSDPTVTATVTYPQLDTGATETFTASASGGSGPYTYTWVLDGNVISSSASFTHVFNTAGARTVEISVTDGNGFTVHANVTVDVVSQPSVSFTEKYSSLDVNIEDIFNSSVEYGTAPYNYTWFVDSGIVGYGSTLEYTFTSAQVAHVNLTVRDADGYTSTYGERIYVYSAPSVSVLANRTAIDQGMSVGFITSAYNGTGPYNFTWEVDGTVIAYGSSFDYDFASYGTYTVSVMAKDAFGETGSASVSILVNKLPSVSAVASHSPIDSGQSDTFTGTVNGGTGPYSYAWFIGGTVVGSSQNLTYIFSKAGPYALTFEVTDSLGVKESYSFSITVNPTLTGSMNVTYNTVDANITDNITLTAFNGTAPYTYAIYINGNLVSSSSSYAQYFTNPGIYDVVAYVNDSMGESVVLKSAIVVRENPTVYITTPTNKTDANVPISFRSILSGGTGPYTYDWLIGGQSYTNATLTHAFSSPGSYDVQVTVTDMFGREAIADINETVFADPHATLIAPSYIRASIEEPMSLNISGGIPSYRMQWYFPSGEQYTGNNITHAFSNAGPETFEVQIKDSTGYTDSQNFTENVHLFVAIAANQTTGLGPLAVQFSSSVLGGSDYSYNWTFSPGHYSLLQNPEYQFPVGNYTVNFHVTSSNGATGSANLSVESLPPPVTFSYSPTVNDTLLSTFNFTAVPNWDASGPYKMSWSFPNGQSLTGMSVSYQFPVYHEFNTVVATFTYGNGQTWTQDISVRLYPAPVKASFSIPKIIPAGTLVNVTGMAQDPDSTSITYSWIFNGQAYSGQNQFFYFGNVGNYSISLTIVDSLGATNTVTHTVKVENVTSNANIVIKVNSVSNGPYDMYHIRVLSSAPLDIVEAFVTDQSVQPVFVNDTDGYNYNLTLNQQNYAPGTYSLKIVVFTTTGESNFVTENFFVSQTYGKGGVPFNLASFFGGTLDMILALISITASISGIIFFWRDKKDKDTRYFNIGGATVKAKVTPMSKFSFHRHMENTSSPPPNNPPPNNFPPNNPGNGNNGNNGGFF